MIKVTGYTSEFLPISVVKVIRRGAGLGLAEGKALMEAVVDGQEVIFAVTNGVDEQSIVEELRMAGVVAHRASEDPRESDPG